MPVQKNTPKNLKLNGVDYLVLKLYLNPGCSQRFLRRELNKYKNGPTRTSSDNYGMYFRRNSRYRDVLWTDLAHTSVWDHMPFGTSWARKPKKSELYLTTKGHARALDIIDRLGVHFRRS
jgi:hypothetical protein